MVTLALGGGGGGSLTKDFQYKGSIAQGDVIKVNTDGTVSKVNGANIPSTLTEVDTQTGFASAGKHEVHFSPSGLKFAMSYVVGALGYIVLGDVDPVTETISLGAPQLVRATRSLSLTMAFIDDSTLAAFYQYNTNVGWSKVGTIASNVISWGAEQQVSVGNASTPKIAYDTNNDRLVYFYAEGGGGVPTIRLASYSGTVLTFGTATTVGNGTSYTWELSYASGVSRFLLCWQDGATRVSARTLDVSDVTPSLGTTVVLTENNGIRPGVAIDKMGTKFVAAFRDFDSSNFSRAVGGQIDGTTITAGNITTINPASSFSHSVAYNEADDNFVISYENATDGYGHMVTTKVQGAELDVSPIFVWRSVAVDLPTVTYFPLFNKLFFAFNNTANSNHPSYIELAALNAEDSFGVAQEGGSNLETHPIDLIGGISSVFSGKVSGAVAYVQEDSTLSEDFTDYPLGRFVSPTECVLTKSP